MDGFSSDLFVRTFVTLLVIMDPIVGVPIFLSLTRGYTDAARNRAALEASGLAAGVILVFAFFGQGILRVLSISLPALQISGGLLLALIALELLSPDDPDRVPSSARRSGNVAIVPLGTPLLAGPGAIAVTMVSMRRADSVAGTVTVSLALIATLMVVYIALRFATLIGRVLTETATAVFSRIVGILAAAIAVQLAASGIQEWIRTGVT